MRDIQRYLNQVYEAMKKLKQLDALLSELNNSSYRLVAHHSEATSGNNLQKDTSNFIAKKMELEKKFEKQKLNWLTKRIEIRRFIYSLDIPADKEYLRSILIFRYVTLKPFTEIAILIQREYIYTVRDLHKKALAIAATKYNLIQ